MTKKTCRILAIDDDPVFLSLIRDALELSGFSVETLEDPNEAVAAIERFPPDVIMLDMLMPDMTGTELCLRLKEKGILGRITVILFSGIDEDIYRQELKQLGVFACLTKPVSIQHLISIVRDAVSPAPGRPQAG